MLCYIVEIKVQEHKNIMYRCYRNNVICSRRLPGYKRKFVPLCDRHDRWMKFLDLKLYWCSVGFERVIDIVFYTTKSREVLLFLLSSSAGRKLGERSRIARLFVWIFSSSSNDFNDLIRSQVLQAIPAPLQNFNYNYLQQWQGSLKWNH